MAFAYLAVLTWVGLRGGRLFASDRMRRLAYGLSLGVYCTGWTFYGSVGLAAEGGWQFLPVYLGPTICAVAWPLLLRKLIAVSKHHRVTSVSDLLAARFRGDRSIGAVASVITVLAIIPYISIQIKVISESVGLLWLRPDSPNPDAVAPLDQVSLYITLVLTAVAIAIGTRRLDPNDRSGAMSRVLAVESLFKLTAFVLVGIFVVWGLGGGWDGFWRQAETTVDLPTWLSIAELPTMNAWSWLWLTVISAVAVLLLPRQFHVAVVENDRADYVDTASWVVPLYFLAISFFVVPIALGGLAQGRLPGGSDFYVLTLPLSADDFVLSRPLAQIVALGGISAATAMVVISTIALSLMVVNNLISPLLLRRPSVAVHGEDLPAQLLALRRLTIAALLILSYGYYLGVAHAAKLISIGLISFAGISQLAPSVLAALYWPRFTRPGALAGMVAGGLVWAYLLPLVSLADADLLGSAWTAEGPFNIRWLAPDSFLGLSSGHPVARAAFWSLLANTCALWVGSSVGRVTPADSVVADQFVNIRRYIEAGALALSQERTANTADLLLLLNRYLGTAAAGAHLAEYRRTFGRDPMANATSSEAFVGYVERHLSGAIGVSSAHLAVSSISREDLAAPLLRSLDESAELQTALTQLQEQQLILEATAAELRDANATLRQLDELKEEFVATVSHELRTPITSIRAISQILDSRPDLEPRQRASFHRTMLAECDRVSRLVTQVLDASAAERLGPSTEKSSLSQALWQAVAVAEPLAQSAALTFTHDVEVGEAIIHAEFDKLVQVFVNVMSNAVKFTPQGSGLIQVRAYLSTDRTKAIVEVRDNGIGIPGDRQRAVFEKFAQADYRGAQKPVGSGLGLYISRAIVEAFGGQIGLRSRVGEGTTIRIELPVAIAMPLTKAVGPQPHSPTLP